MKNILQDSHHRQINYLRLSVTDRCNLRCTYCMPAHGLSLFKRDDLLSHPEIVAIARTAVSLGIRKIRVTGGEPLVRPGIVELLGDLRKIPELDKLVLTTNGIRMAALAKDLRAAGVDGANISIDSLDQDLYRTITRGGNLDSCLDGIEASLAAGLKTKLNMVVMAGVNDHELANFVELSRKLPVAVRFIEYMPTQGQDHNDTLLVPTAQLLAKISQITEIEPIASPKGLTLAGPARNFRVPGALGSLGVISPVTNHFCADCNRIRITATGLARGCLFHETGVDLKPWLESGDEAGLAKALQQVVFQKPIGHKLSERVVANQAPMSRMGG